MMKLRVLALTLAILAFFLFVGSPFEQAAQAIAVVDDAVIAILIAALSACGITMMTSGSYSNVKAYVEAMFINFSENYYTSVDRALYGTRFGSTALGKIVLNNRMLLLVSTFVEYVKNYLSLTDNNVERVQQSGQFLGTVQVAKLPLYYVRYRNQYREIVVIESSRDAYVVGGQGTSFIITISEYPVTVSYNELNSNGVVISSVTRTLSKSGKVGNYDVNDAKICFDSYLEDLFAFHGITTGEVFYAPITDIKAAIENYDSVANQASISISTDEIIPPIDDPNYQEGDGAVIDVGADWGEPLVDIVTETIPGEFEYDKEAEVTIEYVAEDTANQEVVDTDTSGAVSDQPSEYQVTGLEQVFPFCIPFDLYNFVDCLAADPVAPSFEWRFYVPGIVDETIEIDLSPYDSVAQILRMMELLLFCVGLAFVTRKIIRG